MDTVAGTRLGITVQVKASYEATLPRVVEALKAEGFGVLTEIDVKETFQKKLGVGFRPYRILGACNPPLAHRALSVAPEVGLLLPCNVTVSELDPATTEVSLVDPVTLLGIASKPELEPIAQEARARLERVAASLQE